MKRYSVGDRVVWTAYGHTVPGTIVHVLDRGSSVHLALKELEEEYGAKKAPGNLGRSRNEESYIVLGDNKLLYWPRTRWLERILYENDHHLRSVGPVGVSKLRP